MTHPVRPFVLLVCSGLLIGLVSLAGCKKDTDPQAVPVPSGAVVAAPPPSAAAEAASASANASASASAAPATPPPVVQQASIDGCCAALASAGKATKSTGDKDKFLQASKICSG